MVATKRLPRQMLEFFKARVRREQAMALVLVTSTEGSSYSKAAHALLVDDSGEMQGILSGGCLEADLVDRCMRAIHARTACIVDYDLRNDDALFGLAVGCEGAMRVAIHPMTKDNAYEPMRAVFDLLDLNECVDIEIRDDDLSTSVRWIRPARLLLLGAGPDAVPLLEMCSSLGWSVTVNDHRQAWADRISVLALADVRCVATDELSEAVDLSQFDAAIVMSHNLDADRQYLEQLGRTDIPYVGLLGPPHRRDRLMHELQEAGAALTGRLRSPVGRQIGGQGPSAIALEIVVELQEWFCATDQRLSNAARSAGVSISTDAGSKSTTSSD